MPERIAIIDLGSNSGRMIVMHIYNNGAYNLIFHQKETLRLAEGMGRGQLLRPESMERTMAAMQNFSQMCGLMNVDCILAVATAAVRNARNGAEFLDLLTRTTGIPIHAISGETEAHYGYIGAINTLDISDAVLFDLGGGSMELTLVRDRRAVESVSIPLGAVNLSEEFKAGDKISRSTLSHMHRFILQQFKRIPWLTPMSLPLVGIGGTARNIAKIDQLRKNYPYSKVHNYRLGPIALDNLTQLITNSNLAQRHKIPGLSNERADIIVAGVNLVKCLFDEVQASNLIVSGCGVREGLFLQYYLHRENQPEIIPDIVEHSAQNMLLFYKADKFHAEHVARLACKMFDGWQAIHEMDSRDRTLLRCAALLHDVGISINYYDHPRHSAYLVENARLFGLTHSEQVLVAVLTAWHSGFQAKLMRNRVYSEFLDDADWIKAKKLAVILTLANCLDSTQRHLVKDINLFLTDTTAEIFPIAEGDISLDLLGIGKHRKWFQREFGLDLIVQPPKLGKG